MYMLLTRAGTMYTFTHVNFNNRVNLYKFQPAVKDGRIQPTLSFFLWCASIFYQNHPHHLHSKLKSKCGKHQLVTG